MKLPDLIFNLSLVQSWPLKSISIENCILNLVSWTIILRVSCLIIRYCHNLEELHPGLLVLGKFTEGSNKPGNAEYVRAFLSAGCF